MGHNGPWNSRPEARTVCLRRGEGAACVKAKRMTRSPLVDTQGKLSCEYALGPRSGVESPHARAHDLGPTSQPAPLPSMLPRRTSSAARTKPALSISLPPVRGDRRGVDALRPPSHGVAFLRGTAFVTSRSIRPAPPPRFLTTHTPRLYVFCCPQQYCRRTYLIFYLWQAMPIIEKWFILQFSFETQSNGTCIVWNIFRGLYSKNLHTMQVPF